MTSRFTIRDYVVVFAGTNNTLSGISIKDEILLNLANNLSHTNLIILSIAYRNHTTVCNRLVYETYYKLYNFAQTIRENQSALFMDINYISGSEKRIAIHLGKADKQKILKNISLVIEEASRKHTRYVNYDHLTYINCTTDKVSQTITNFCTHRQCERMH